VNIVQKIVFIQETR
jgi:hypothetical protein